MKKHEAVKEARIGALMQGGTWYVTRKRDSYNYMHSDRYDSGRHGTIAEMYNAPKVAEDDALKIWHNQTNNNPANIASTTILSRQVVGDDNELNSRRAAVKANIEARLAVEGIVPDIPHDPDLPKGWTRRHRLECELASLNRYEEALAVFLDESICVICHPRNEDAQDVCSVHLAAQLVKMESLGLSEEDALEALHDEEIARLTPAVFADVVSAINNLGLEAIDEEFNDCMSITVAGESLMFGNMNETWTGDDGNEMYIDTDCQNTEPDAAKVARAIVYAVLAYEFSVVLWRDIGAKDMHKVIKRNGTKAYSDGCCATHDFIDANMAMAEAFEVHKIHDIAGFDGDCPKQWVAIDLWNGAWDKARKDKFAL